MTTIPVCMIEQNSLFREGFKSLLHDTDYLVKNSYYNWREAEKNLEFMKDSQLFIISCVEAKDGISILKQLDPTCRIVVFADAIDIDQIISSFSAGADGYLLRSILPRALIGSMDMIMAGEKVCPAAIMHMLAEKNLQITYQEQNKAATNCNLSSREIEILRFLATGDSNKQIARNLEITEGTVKGHIKAVLRKLDVSNRTQAAIWAVNKGLASNIHANAA